MRSRSLLQGIFLIQESNWGLLHCRQILYQLSYRVVCMKYTQLTPHAICVWGAVNSDPNTSLIQKSEGSGNSLEIQWLGLCIPTAEDPGPIPARGTEILQAMCVSKAPAPFHSESYVLYVSCLPLREKQVFLSPP